MRKDDLFEVVFNPGTDEVEKQGLGPAPATCRDTGNAPAFKRNLPQPRGNLPAERIHSIGGTKPRQFWVRNGATSCPPRACRRVPARRGRARLGGGFCGRP